MAGILKYNQQKQEKEPTEPAGKFMGLILLIWRKIWELTKVNLISFIFYIPFFVVVWVATYWFMPSEGAELLNYQIYTPSDAALIDLLRRLTFGTILVTVPIVVFGPITAGATYIYRCLVKKQPFFLWGDMFAYTKKFFVKGMMITVIDIAVLFLSGVALQIYPQILDGFFQAVVVWVIIMFLVIFFMMHFYIYQLLIEYNLSIFKLYRFSFVFSLLRLIPNLLILIACLFISLAPFAIHIMVGNGVLIFLSIALCGIIINYFSWPAIEKHFSPLVKR